MADISDLAREIIDSAKRDNLMIVTAESCTGGLVSSSLTSVSGSSESYWGGFVTYSNESKITLLGVPLDLLERDGAVSASVAESMARGALLHSGADVSVSVTGIAGPGGGSPTKPVGLVYVAVVTPKKTQTEEYRFGDDLSRNQIRTATTIEALSLLLRTLQSQISFD